MKIKSAEFKVSAPDLRSCPNWDLPEFAFIGRSNVGKSSLVNLLTERRDLAKVSDTPGKTKLINFFVINGAWCLVDLPGYGYAEGGKQRRIGFNEAIGSYFSGRPNLGGVFVLIDSRLPPQPIDLGFLQWLDGGAVPFALIFTKTDKQSVAKGLANIEVFKAAMRTWRAELPDILTSSATTRAGRADILHYIAGLLANLNRPTG